ncbi:hypothetical protein [Paenibacillus sp. FSL K6-0108]|uniref:hypothetical protein n=1 Tax=Paenibacillus sp. FSL K6-0108 TaxID=2921417 RepID=UPI00324EC412
MEDQNEDFLTEEEQAQEEKKKARIEQEVQRLHNNLSSGNLDTLISRVAYVLNNYKESRNSDMILKIKYWQIFQGVTGNTIDIKDMFKLERDTQISRARAKIQNEYKLFQADQKIRWYRKGKEEAEKEVQISNKPSHPSLTIFADESGKSGADKYLIIGGLWVLDHNRVHELQSHFKKWKADSGNEATEGISFY